MGRIRRQRRYKSCDPFSTQKQKQEKYDLPPQRKDESDIHFEETKSVQYFQEQIDKAKNKKRVKTNKKKLPCTSDGVGNKYENSKGSTGKLPHETTQKYLERLDQNVQQAINSAMMESKTLRKKRKVYLKSRDEKRKTKKQKTGKNKVEDFASLRGNAVFGDVAYQPPTSLAIPRKASSIKKSSDLKLMSLICPDKEDVKKRRDMSVTEKEIFDDERQKVINAYRLMKQRKEIGKDTT